MKKILQYLSIIMLGIIFFPSLSHASTLSLYPNSGTLKTGCEYSVGIHLDTLGVNTTAVDAFLNYNPNEIEIVNNTVYAGTLFGSYPGNIVGGGNIKLTAYNQGSVFNGKGTFASFKIKAKPGVKKSTISFNFTPGSSTDSNVANENSQDILKGAYGATYTFEDGNDSCNTSTSSNKISDNDRIPPKILKTYPKKGDIQVKSNSDVAFIIEDRQSGINLGSIRIMVDNILYTKNGENKFKYSGNKYKYKVWVNPIKEFPKNKSIAVSMSVKDMKNNITKVDKYLFNEFIPSNSCKQEYAYACSNLHSSAGEKNSNNLIWWLIILAISLFFNIEILLKPNKAKKRHMFIKKIIKKIKIPKIKIKFK